ncbi:MAG: phosphatidylserine decarboxylase [Gammaproteobacteria bacterium]|nr:phosphatidylserine decarboxylase [Gammaproteobacteria bacterium]
MLDRLFVLLLQLLPHHLLSRAVWYLTRWRWAPFKNRAIRGFIKAFDVEMAQAQSAYAVDYADFNAFFPRSLRPGARPLCAEGQLASPADGKISAIGRIEQDSILQAKGMDYSLRELLGGDAALAEGFRDGHFATIYLSPRDYHRVHMPLSGQLREMIHIPGRLFSVNGRTARTLPRLFSRNERLVCLFDTQAGPMAVILVGAIFVGCMDTVWAGTVAPTDLRNSRWRYGEVESGVQLERGAEMGRFNMGSTVILLLPKGALSWQDHLREGSEIRMGEGLGQLEVQP